MCDLRFDVSVCLVRALHNWCARGLRLTTENGSQLATGLGREVPPRLRVSWSARAGGKFETAGPSIDAGSDDADGLVTIIQATGGSDKQGSPSKRCATR